MGKSACAMVDGRIKHTSAYDGEGGINLLPFWCICANLLLILKQF